MYKHAAPSWTGGMYIYGATLSPGFRFSLCIVTHICGGGQGLLTQLVELDEDVMMQLQWNLRIMDTLGTSICPLFRGCPFFGGRNVKSTHREGANSLSIVGRLSTV